MIKIPIWECIYLSYSFNNTLFENFTRFAVFGDTSSTQLLSRNYLKPTELLYNMQLYISLWTIFSTLEFDKTFEIASISICQYKIIKFIRRHMCYKE